MENPDYSPNGFDFKKIVFGKMDASKETSSPQLLLDGYLDANGYIEQLVEGDMYYVFGQKGSGKSAIASKIELMARTEGKISAKIYDLGQFDYAGFSGVIPGVKTESISKGLTTWEFLIALKLLENYDINETKIQSAEVNLNNIVKGLKSIGLIPSKGFNGIIDRMKHKAFQISGSVAGTGASIGLNDSENISNQKIRAMIKNVINAMYNVSPLKKQFIIIDGLDSSLGKRTAEYDVISSLINATDLINRNLMDNEINAKIIVLCRNDILDRLSGTNKNKFTIDSGIQLDWYQPVKDPRETNLNKLIDLRAKVSLGSEISVMDEFFPPYIPVNNGHKDTLKFLLENTRHTPRDFIALMNNIQRSSYKKGATVDSILNGIRKYSDDYFVGEIKDGLDGLMSKDDQEMLFRAIKHTGHILTNVTELADEMSVDKQKAIELLETLYDSGAIVNVNPNNGQYTSKYRNRHSSFDPNQKIRIHQGLVKAFSLTGESNSPN